VHEDWQGGPFQNSTYRWIGGKLELIEQDGLSGDWSLPDGFTFSCSRRLNGKMITTLEKSFRSPEEMDALPDCPAVDSASENSRRYRAQARD
jgi:hypothetical protein